MYILLGIDTVFRIALALALLFVAVPALACGGQTILSVRDRQDCLSPTSMERFWWNLGVGLVVLTLAGQLFTLLNIAGTLTYLALLAAIVVVLRARRAGISPLQWIARSYHAAVRFALHVLDGRASLRRRIARTRRLVRVRIANALREHRATVATWTTIAVVAGGFRLYRPFATANLGFSDTYVHLYLMRLLDAGRQVDPAWGPYPRGMHFLLLAIERLTNADEILLMNFFGAFAGVLMALSAAYAAKRVAGSNVAALVAGLLFATMIGGPLQYFALGGSVSTNDTSLARNVLAQRYQDLLAFGEFDVLLTTFARQTSTLPQELAIALLFPAALFLLDWLRTVPSPRSRGEGARRADEGRPSPGASRHPLPAERGEGTARWHLAGFIACTASIAAIHSGVLIPLVLLCAAAAIAVLVTKTAPLLTIVRGAIAGAIGIAIGSTWMLGFFAYRPTRYVGSTAQYYFPFLRSAEEETSWMMLTPFLIAMLAVAAILAIRERKNAVALWLTIATALFILTHAATVIGIPEIVEVRRNASWLAMAVAALIGAALAYTPRVVPAVILAGWLVTIPLGPFMREKLLDYSGYGSTAYAVLKMSNQLEPFTWTLVSYGQEYPMVIGRGFHLSGADFLERYDPAAAPLPIPTPYVFIAVEKNPHRFEINNWASRFDRAAIEERLETWCTLYRMTHRDMRIWLDDENVRVYAIERRPELAALGAR